MTSLSVIVKDFSQSVVPAMSKESIAFFNNFYQGTSPKQSPNREASIQDETVFVSIKDLIRSSSNPEKRAERLVNFVQKNIDEIIEKQKEKNKFERSEEQKIIVDNWIKTKFRTIIDSCLLLKDALDLELFPKNKKIKKGIEELTDSENETKAKEFINKFLKWTYTGSITPKLPDFGDEDEYDNVALYQQLSGHIPVSPICEQILPFSMLDWQKRMFKMLREKKNVIVCAPTSSGKTMIATGYIIAFLQNELKSLLVYIVPNEVLALEISALLHKYVNDKVSTILDRTNDRKIDERVIVATPKGAKNSGLVQTHLPENALLVVDETHCIGHKGGSMMEFVLRRMSKAQTLILSATMTQETIHKLSLAIRNKQEIEIINETTKFIVPQYMIPKSIDENVKLVSINPIGSVSVKELSNPDLDISMTARDVLAFFVKTCNVFGNQIPEYLHPLRFFYIHRGNVPTEYIPLDEVEPENDEVPTGIIGRLTMEDIAKWQKAIINFLNNPPKTLLQEYEQKGEKWAFGIEKVINSFKACLTDETTSTCNPENAFKLVEQLKANNMLQAIFFFPSLYKAFQYASHIYHQLLTKKTTVDIDKKDRKRESKIQGLKKQLRGMETVKLKHGADARELKQRRYQIEMVTKNLENQATCFQAQNSLNPDRIIDPEAFEKLVKLFKNWNKNITQSSALPQMFIYGIGLLSGDMPPELQVMVRQLYSTGQVSLLMTTEDCAYGINTPTRTVILSDGFTETQRRQMAGRAGRKGLSYDAWIVTFRLTDPEEAGQKLKTLVGEEVVLYSSKTPFPGENTWITKIIRQNFTYGLSSNQIEDDQLNKFHFASRFMYGHGSILSPFILEAIIKSSKNFTNRHICTILSILPCTPFNQPFQNNGWNYDIPAEVCKIYSLNGLDPPVPNYLLYCWLTNQTNEMRNEDKEKFVENVKHWIYLFHLLEPFFPEKTKNDEGEKILHKQIIDTFTKCLIETSIGL